MKYGYVKPKTMSHLVDFERMAKADKLVTDFGNNGKLYDLLQEVKSGDEVVIDSLENAFAETDTFDYVTDVLGDKGVSLRTVDNDFVYDMTNNADMARLVKKMSKFYLEKTEERNVSKRGRKPAQYPENWLDIVDRFRDHSLSVERATEECGFNSHNTFYKLYFDFVK